MKKRSIGLMILLAIITGGIYIVIWSCLFQAELKKETGEGFGAIGHFFMMLFTFGIYSIYWQYAAGKRLEKQGVKSDHSILYLVFCFVALSFLNPFLMQAQANEIA